MAVSKVVYGGRTLIDLTGDTVAAGNLLRGCTAHRADGTAVAGTLLAGYPRELFVEERVSDSYGDDIWDRNESVVEGRIGYRRM